MWLKGNLHTHTNRSDGDSSPDEVVEWYRHHGYDFLSITDHGRFTDPAGVRDQGLILIPGTELGVPILDTPGKSAHVNGFGISETIEPEAKGGAAECLQGMVGLVLRAGGIAQINHPNWGYAFEHPAMMPVQGWTFLEVFNGHPQVNNLGGEGHPPVELMWDELLAAGRRVLAVAVDDSHHFREFSPQRANPGRGWVVVNAEERRADAILSAMGRGDFYASTGPTLRSIAVEGGVLRVEAEPSSGGSYRIELIGGPGITLADAASNAAEFRIADFAGRSRGYLRARVSATNGSAAWTQPVLVES